MPQAIDLGLPSGLKWASFNLGASAPEEYGDYYAWGETEPYYSSQDPLALKDGKTGYDWSSSLSGLSDCAWYMRVYSDFVSGRDASRYFGFSVRPVSE